MYIDTLDVEQVNQQQVIETVMQSLMIVAPQMESIDFPSISPPTEPEGSGHDLKFFKGELKVPLIEREHDVEVLMEQDTTDFSIPLPILALPSFAFGMPRIRGKPGKGGNRRKGGKGGKRYKKNRAMQLRRSRLAEKRARDKARKAARKTGRPKRRADKTRKKQDKRTRKQEQKKAKQNQKKPSGNLKDPGQDSSDDIARDSKKIKPDSLKSKNVTDKLKKRLVDKFPERYKFDKAGNLRAIKPDGKTKPVSKIELSDAIDELVDITPYAGALKTLQRVAGVAGIVFTTMDLYALYDIYTDDKLSNDEKITRSGPIIGELLGSYGAAIVGGLGGGAVAGPWGAFFGAVAGGITGAFAGSKVGEIIAEYIVGDPPPVHPSGKSWDELTPEELETWWTYEATQLEETYIDNTQTQQQPPQPFPDLNPQAPQLQIIPDAKPPSDVPVPSTTIDTPDLAPSEQIPDMTSMEQAQIDDILSHVDTQTNKGILSDQNDEQLLNMVNMHIDKNIKHNQQRHEMIDKIKEFANG